MNQKQLRLVSHFWCIYTFCFSPCENFTIWDTVKDCAHGIAFIICSSCEEIKSVQQWLRWEYLSKYKIQYMKTYQERSRPTKYGKWKRSNLSISVTLWFLVEATSSTLPAAFRLMSLHLLDIAFDLLLSWTKVCENCLDPWHLVFLMVAAWLAQCLKKTIN